jgi:EAL domain-containing protein (putative c-di-GMP-specific phosphodiesterase class I)
MLPGPNQVQGFFFGKPLSASEIAAGMLADFSTAGLITHHSQPT